MQQKKEKWQEVIEERKRERLITKIGLASILAIPFYFIQPYISKIFYPKEVVEVYNKIDELERKANLAPPDEAPILRKKIETIKEKVGKEYPLRPTFLDFLRALRKGNAIVILNFIFQGILGFAGFIGFFYFYRLQPLRFVFRQPTIEPAIDYGKFDPQFIQPEKWGVDRKKFLSLFESEEDFKKFVQVINSRMKRKIELFEGGYKEFNPDEVNALIGKLLDIIEREGDILATKRVSEEEKWHMRASLGLAILHRIIFWFGHIPEGVLSIFFKKDDELAKTTKLVLAEYPKGKTLRPSNPIYERAGRYLSYLHLAKVSASDFPEDLNLFDTPEMGILEFIDKKFKTLPD